MVYLNIIKRKILLLVGFPDLKALSLKDDLEREDINKLIAYIKPLMINATDRNVINHDNYQF